MIAIQWNPDLLRARQNAALVILAIIGVVAAARRFSKERIKRVPVADLMANVCRLAVAEGYGVFLYGTKPAVVSQAAPLLLGPFRD